MDYTKLHWIADYTSSEIYGEYVEEFGVGLYRFIDFPEILVYINCEIDEIIEVMLDESQCLPTRLEGSD